MKDKIVDIIIEVCNVEAIREYAFAGCTGLTKAIIFNKNTQLDETAYEGCSSDLTFYCYKDSDADKYAKATVFGE